ncbi:DUF2993 domain-containing protein [Lysinimonas soli]|uniref:DUF2993 domain-containing protein n=1 Tax=Lysinimonas soli TaxID=1074233 RepID=A0ABW0NQK7_9MICO
MSTGAAMPAAPGTGTGRARRRRGLIALAVVLVVLALGTVVADAAARAYAESQIRQKLVSALGVAPGTPVSVDIGGGSVLLQALGGRFDSLDVAIPKLSYGELVGAATVHATSVPLDGSAPLGTLAVGYSVDEKNMTALASRLSGLPLDTITLESGRIVATATVRVLGFGIPIGLGLTPSVSNGQMVFTPSSIQVSGQTFTAQQLRTTPGFSQVARALLTQRSFCLAQYLPKALTVTSVTVADHRLTLSASGDGAVLGGTDLTTKGGCS